MDDLPGWRNWQTRWT